MKTKQSSPEVADIFCQYKQQYLQQYSPTMQQLKTIDAIINCRTAALGGHTSVCTDCGAIEQSYNSCRNRHCPKCQHNVKQKWLDARKSEALPVAYLHLVFTVPHTLNPVFLCNKEICYRILFKAVWQTLNKFALDTRWLGAQIGAMAILHTWGQNLSYHPHIHVVMPAGGLSEDKNEWCLMHKKFFAPVKAISAVFRATFMRLLSHESVDDNFNVVKDHGNILKLTMEKPWVVFAQKPFKSPKNVIEYLGNYTHRVAISNHRIVKIQDDMVYFRYKDYANGNKQKVMKIKAVEFIRRFVEHILPQRFFKIRYFGFLSNRNRSENIGCALQALADLNILHSTCQIQNSQSQSGVQKCPHCGGVMVVLHEIEQTEYG